jgi:hypothetical protein
MTANTSETPRFYDEGIYERLERIFREHIADEHAQRDAFNCLKELRLLRAALIHGVGATMRYLEAYNELPQKDKPSKPAICPISNEAMDELYLWQKRINAEIYRGYRPRGST